MNRTFRTITKFATVTVVVLLVASVAFTAGFGSAYVLSGRDILPRSIFVEPTAPPSNDGREDASAPTPTLVPVPTPRSDEEQTFQLFWEAWDLVQRHYYGELPTMQDLTYSAIQGMLESLDDDYTAFIEPQVAAILDEDATGEFEGIGAFVDMDASGKLEIVRLFENGPAEKAGLKAGDRVLAVDGVSIVGKSLYEAIGLIRGETGSDVELLIEREDTTEPFKITVTRARLEIPITEVEMREDGIGYIRLYEFSATAQELMEEGMENLLEEDPQGIVFDLRGNPGGWLDQAISVADLFIDEGVIAIERFSDGDEKRFEASSGDIGEEIPMVVLVNGGSASGSEIVAGALQDQERATLIGEATFGKGSVQRPFTLSDGSELRVTIALWFTPANQAIENGLEPDIRVPFPEDADPDEDPQLERAVEYLLEIEDE